MKTTNVCEVGSIQMLVPVNPVWPNEPRGKSSPRLDEKELFMSHPSPRVAPSSVTTYGCVMRAIVWAERIRLDCGLRIADCGFRLDSAFRITPLSNSIWQ